MKVKGRILLVEDDEMVARFFISFLQLCDYAADYFSQPKPALRYFKQNPDNYLAVITDLNMAEMSGYELAQEIKRIKPEFPIVLCSGLEVQEIQGTGVYIDHVLAKPVDMDELERILDQYVRRQLLSANPA